MSKNICEKSLFNILLYRKHKFQINSKTNNNMCKNTTLDWVKKQSNTIDEIGFNKWYNNTNGRYGPPSHLKIRKNPLYYDVTFFNKY